MKTIGIILICIASVFALLVAIAGYGKKRTNQTPDDRNLFYWND
jgi:hypothetical protein